MSQGRFDSRIPEGSHWRNAGRWLVWAVPFSAAPLLGSALMLVLLGEWSRVPDLVAEGQLGLYAATVVGVAAYICAVDRESTVIRWRMSLLLAAFLILLVDAVIYTSVQIVEIIELRFDLEIMLDGSVIAVVTSIAYLAALLVAYLANVADGERQSLGISEIRRQQRDDLTQQFRELGDD